MAFSSSSTNISIVLKAVDETKGAIDSVVGNLNRMRNSVAGIAKIAIGDTIGNLGADAIRESLSGIKDFSAGMIDANSQIQLMKQRLDILYQSAAEGAQAFAFVKQNELTEPFNANDILNATVQLVAFKQNITSVLPALEDVAGAMGTTLPYAAQAFTDAMQGRFQMLKRGMGISKEELVQFGLQMNAAGHITDPNSFVTSFLALANSSQFKGGADKLSQTWSGLMSSMESQWFYLKANIGQGAFDVLEKQLSGLVHTLQNPGNSQAIQSLEEGLGAGLAQATVAAIKFGETVGPYVGSAIELIARAWPLMEQGASQAFNFVGGIVSQFGNWLQNTGYPAIESVIGAFASAWDDVEPVVQQTLQTLTTDFGQFVVAVSDQAGPLMEGLAGAFRIGMGAVELTWGSALTLLSGDWAGFQNDFNTGINTIIVGAADLIAALETGWGAKLGNALMGPWTSLAIGVRQIIKDVSGYIGDIAGVAAIAFTPFMQGIALLVNSTQNAMKLLIQALPTTALSHLLPGKMGDAVKELNASVMGMTPYKMPSFGDNFASTKKSITDFINQNSPGIDPNQYIHAGVSNAQFAADIEQARQQVIKDMTGIAPGGPVVGQTFATKSGPGKDIVDAIQNIFKGLGGQVTLSDLLKAFGFTDIGKGKLAFTGNNLPVTGSGGGGAATAAAAAGSASTGLAKTGRVPLGNLGADFMSAIISTSGLSQGTDPATRAAQQQVTQQQTQIAQTTKQTAILEALSASAAEAHDVLVDIRTFFNRLTMPNAVPINPLQVHGVSQAG